jgi:hypothetical protein
VNPQAGIVAAMLVGLWIAYLVPHRLRTRQELLEARQDDRFSADLRVLRAASAPTVRTAERHVGHGKLVERPVVRVTEGTMELNRSAVDSARRAAAERSQRAALLARRAAAARRRGLLTLALALLTVAGWVVYGVTTASVAVGIVPSVLLVAVIAASRAAVVSAQRADEKWEASRARATREAPRRVSAVSVGGVAGVSKAVSARFAEAGKSAGAESEGAGKSAGQQIAVGQAVHPSEQLTEFISEAPVARPVETSGEGIPALIPVGSSLPAEERPTVWEPRPVPAPAYTLKQSAPRRTAAPIEIGADGRELDSSLAEAAAEAAVAEATAEVTATAGTAADDLVDDVLAEPDVVTTGSMDLNQILARRRAAGL